jgi:diguanylate cyclase (GGDEF)-like protein/putative nucleotidyltransferase with HDIG domain
MGLPLADSQFSAPVASGSAGTSSEEATLMVRTLAALFAAGATLALLTVALPHSQHASELGLLAIVANAYLISCAMFWYAERLPSRLMPYALSWGSTLITGVAYFSAQSPSPLIFFYLWIFLYSAYFFTTRELAIQLLYVGAAYAALLIARPPADGAPEWWIVAMGSLVIAAILIRVMRNRAELLIARLYDSARTDPLTQLSNRHGFRELLDLEFARARRSRTQMTVIVGDLDHFKEVNDRSGMHVGDAALRRAAGVLASGKRDIDGLARVAGEQFALVLPDSDEHAAFVLAERLRCDLAAEFAGDAVPLTISFGVAHYPEHGETASSLLRAADDALFAAKGNGRDRTMLHRVTMREAPRPDGELRDLAEERFIAVILDLAEAVDLRFSGTARHSETVGRYAEMMARQLGLSEQQTARVRLAGLLHDIGKVAVPDTILQKPGKLTDEEFDTIKRHPELGAQILEHPSLADVREWVAAHHERPDGRGYPRGLSGAQIALEARILAVADSYEAMTSDRAYRSAIAHTAAREELERCTDTQFDADVVAALIAVLERESERAETTLARA